MVHQTSGPRKSTTGPVPTKSAIKTSRSVMNESKFEYTVYKYRNHISGNMQRDGT